MASMKYLRAELSQEEQNKIVQAVINGTMDVNEAASAIGISPEILQSLKDNAMKKYSTTSVDYGNDVQKIMSYKGTIRQMDLIATNQKGGKYPLKVVNIYIKPNTERYYEEKVYSVDKDKIRKGTPGEGFYPDHALWSKPPRPGKKKVKIEGFSTARKRRKLPVRVKSRRSAKRIATHR
jgi:hypothetical protein